ncbi:MAG: metallophosphoesterase, partial [Candidatus Obscuribacterales bacterium]|nr:metallophosphoesterase [Candidatus Obscuribacterales bacterium]
MTENNNNTSEDQITKTSFGFYINRRRFLFSLAAASILGWPEKAHATLTPIKPFSFAYVADVHLSNSLADTHLLYHESQLFLQEAIKQINMLDVDFTIFGGDQVEGPGDKDENWNLFVDVVKNLQNPWDFVLGDRDISGRLPIDKMRTYGLDWKGKGIEFDTPYWSRSPEHNTHLIGLDSSVHGSKEGTLSQKQLAWLKNELIVNQSKFTIIFSHHPLLPPPPFNGGEPWSNFDIVNSASALEIISTSNYVKMVVSAHVGINKVQKERNTYHISGPALIGYPCAFKVFR